MLPEHCVCHGTKQTRMDSYFMGDQGYELNMLDVCTVLSVWLVNVAR